MLSPVVPEEFNLAAFLLDRHLAEDRTKKPVIYFGQQIITYADLENRVMTCRARRLARYKGISCGN